MSTKTNKLKTKDLIVAGAFAFMWWYCLRW